MPDSSLLTTQRFLLREFAERDRDAFVSCHLDPVFSSFHLEGERGAAHASGVFDLFLAWQRAAPRRNVQLAIVSRQQAQEYVGNVGARTQGLPRGHAELGIELVPAFWGRGAATEIMEVFLPWVKRELNLMSFAAETAPGNTAAEQLARRAGMRVVGQAGKTEWHSD